MSNRMEVSRRTFLQASLAAGGGLLLGFELGPAARAEAASAASDTGFEPNAWLSIADDGTVTVRVASSEMGQGVMTAIPMLVAEELDANWKHVRAEFAPVDPAYTNPRLRSQATGGSTAVRGFWTSVREAGAAAREMLLAAAAQTWAVDVGECRTDAGKVVHAASGRSLEYGALVATAAVQPLPELLFLKDPTEFTLVGQSLPRLDTPAKTDGSAVFGQDVRLPGMLTATVLRCPVFGGKLRRFDAQAAKRIAGVREVLQISSGIAVVADGFWPANLGRDALSVEWDEGPGAELDDDIIRNQFRGAVTGGRVVRNDGDAEAMLAAAADALKAVYEVPFLAHACMEPMNATADVRKDGCDIWAPTQGQTATQQTAMKLTGLPAEKVRVHTTFLGGGFGRRSEVDFIADAVEISIAVGRPVKVIWTREDDIQHDFYRPATYNELAAVLGKNGLPQAWIHRIAGPSILARRFPDRVRDAADFTNIEGAANIPYAIPNVRVSYAMVNPGVPVGFWRSVGSSQNAFITECFLDELAAAAGKDPVEYRRALLVGHPRHENVLELAARKSGWGSPLPPGRYRGIAVAESFASFVAQVAEVSVDAQQGIRVHRVVCAVDCGVTVNPGIIEAQMESGIVYGLTAALKGQITIDRGRVRQSNFNDYPMLTIAEMPSVEVHILPSREDPGGVGEPGTPPIAPAVANAVFAATGRPVRRLPVRL